MSGRGGGGGARGGGTQAINVQLEMRLLPEGVGGMNGCHDAADYNEHSRGIA